MNPSAKATVAAIGEVVNHDQLNALITEASSIVSAGVTENGLDATLFAAARLTKGSIIDESTYDNIETIITEANVVTNAKRDVVIRMEDLQRSARELDAAKAAYKEASEEGDEAKAVAARRKLNAAKKKYESVHLKGGSYNESAQPLDESIFDPVGPKMKKLKEIKDAKPREYDGPKEVKTFVDKYYDDIIKISKLVEAEPDKLRKEGLGNYISMMVTIIGSYGALCAYMLGTAGLAVGILGTIGIIGSIVWSLAYAFIAWLRAIHDQKAIDDIAKIRNALRKVNINKLPEQDRHRVQDCLRAIDDAETEVSARFKISEAASDADEVNKRRSEYLKEMDRLNKEEVDAQGDTSWSGITRRVDIAQQKSAKSAAHNQYENERYNNRAEILTDPKKWKDEFAKEREAAKKRSAATNECAGIMSSIWGSNRNGG